MLPRARAPPPFPARRRSLPAISVHARRSAPPRSRTKHREYHRTCIQASSRRCTRGVSHRFASQRAARNSAMIRWMGTARPTPAPWNSFDDNTGRAPSVSGRYLKSAIPNSPSCGEPSKRTASASADRSPAISRRRTIGPAPLSAATGRCLNSPRLSPARAPNTPGPASHLSSSSIPLRCPPASLLD